MENPAPQIWHDSIEQVMERFDIEARPQWQPIVERNSRIVLGLFVRIDDSDDEKAEIALQTVFEHIPEVMWQNFDTTRLLYRVADVLGHMRGKGLHPDGMPRYIEPGYDLHALAICTTEHHVAFNLESHTLYLHDSTGNFYTRRFMGESTQEPLCTRGWIDPELDADEAWQQAQDHPHFHQVHAGLNNLVTACLATPERCREVFADPKVDDMIDMVRELGPIAFVNPFDPRARNN